MAVLLHETASDPALMNDHFATLCGGLTREFLDAPDTLKEANRAT